MPQYIKRLNHDVHAERVSRFHLVRSTDKEHGLRRIFGAVRSLKSGDGYVDEILYTSRRNINGNNYT
jgi:hypothetical protein